MSVTAFIFSYLDDVAIFPGQRTECKKLSYKTFHFECGNGNGRQHILYIFLQVHNDVQMLIRNGNNDRIMKTGQGKSRDT